MADEQVRDIIARVLLDRIGSQHLGTYNDADAILAEFKTRNLVVCRLEEVPYTGLQTRSVYVPVEGDR